MTPALDQALTGAGFSQDGSGRTPRLAGMLRAKLAALAVLTVTGVDLMDAGVFTGPWTGGLSPQPRPGA
ncbi:hypothetical protein AB0A69_33480 [Streptomyces sp. NPDC045431]|uniref:hypothetical protein n=1 Tax=Streptomyces sp. NPDC045431 TaxID=3155613 RepID=UPI003407B27F